MVIQIHIDDSLCKGCALCVYYCPRDVFAMGRRSNPKGYTLVEIRDEAACVGCRLCEIACPDLALYIERTEPTGRG